MRIFANGMTGARSRAALFALALPALLLSAHNVCAAPPFTAAPPSFAPTTVTSIPSTSCTDYDNAVSTAGAAINGANHPGYCQYAGFEPLFNGLPFAQYWQEVAHGAVPPPFQLAAVPGTLCVGPGSFQVRLSANVQNSILNWPNAASIGTFCQAEWQQHDPANLVSQALISARVSQILSHYADYLNRVAARPPGPIMACGLRFNTPQGRALAVAQLAMKLQNLLAPAVAHMQHALPPQTGTSSGCLARCSQCAHGWVGTAMLNMTFKANNIPYFAETDTFYLGGSPPGSTDILADWTARVTPGGPATYNDPAHPGSSIQWQLNADALGQCPPLGQGVCVRITNGAFHDVNAPLSVPNAFAVTQTTPTSTHTSTAAAGETQIQTPNITTSNPQNSATTLCYSKPPLNPGTYTCDATWSWNLGMQ